MPLVEGPVLELGVGFNSTPFLHWLCQDKGLQLESFEHISAYYRFFRTFRGDNHKLTYIKNWDDLKIDKHWGLVFIDHCAERRTTEVIRLANNADYVVIHDTQDDENNPYSLEKIWPHYKYRKDFNQFSPRTTILSNFKELDNL